MQAVLLSLSLVLATTNIQTPESAFYDAASNQLFVSNVAGNAADKDGNGWIATIEQNAAGETVVTRVVEGLDAPKGLIARDGRLFVTDIDRVLEIDVKTHAVLSTTAVPGATFLNDPALADDGTLYVSDMIASRIYAVKDGVATLFAAGEDLESPNGLLIRDGKLIVAAWGFITDPTTFGVTTPGHVYAIDLKTKTKTLITKAPLGNLDGLVVAPNGDFVVTDWVAGKIYRVTAAGLVSTVAAGLTNPADLGIRGNTLIVPEMGADRVSTLKLD